METDAIKLYEDYRPSIHFSPPEGWMNDPNGLVYHKGLYHLFYQHWPQGLTHGPMHWGHAVSEDLLHWRHWPIALEPDALGEIFSGSAVLDEGNTAGFARGGQTPMVAVYTQHRVENGRQIQCQSLAYSFDEGRSFEKYAGNPVLCDPEPDFRDPKVFWHEGRGRWVMPLAVGRSVRLYGSANLKDWALLSTFTTANPSPAGIWECPDLCRLPLEGGGEKWVLLVSVNDPAGDVFGMQVFVGEFDGEAFTAENPADEVQLVDFTSDNYAAVTYNNVEGRVVLVGWMNNWHYADKVPATTFRGSMAIPRELALGRRQNRWRLLQRPVRELAAAARPRAELADAAEAELPPGPLVLTLALAPAAQTIRLESADATLVIGADPAAGRLELDRRGCGQPQLGEGYGRSFSAAGDPYTELTVLLDTASAEVFTDRGDLAGTLQVFQAGPFARISSTAPFKRLAVARVD